MTQSTFNSILIYTMLAIVTGCAINHFGMEGIGVGAGLWLLMPYDTRR